MGKDRGQNSISLSTHQATSGKPILLGLLLIATGLLPLAEIGIARGQQVAQADSTSTETDGLRQTFTGRLDANSSTLEDGSYYATHTFEGTAGEAVTFDLTSEEFDTFLVLLDPNGETGDYRLEARGATEADVALSKASQLNRQAEERVAQVEDPLAEATRLIEQASQALCILRF